jgi:dimethylamine/trimethylamine dehydrogenase
VANYRQIQLEKLKNVEVHLNTRLSAQDILEYGAEIVIIATGFRFASDGMNPSTHAPIEGVDTTLDWQLTPDEVVKGNKPIGERVLVLENEAYYMGASVAQKLAGQGKQVHLLTQLGDIAGYMEYTLEAPMLHRDLHRLGVDIRPYTMLEKVEPGACHAYNVWNPAHKEVFEVDTVVLCTQRLGNDELYHELRADPDRLKAEGIENVFMIGDAAAPRMIVDSVFDGHRLAREIDSDNPAMPLPFIRERRLWGSTSNDDFEAQLLQPPDVEPLAEVTA